MSSVRRLEIAAVLLVFFGLGLGLPAPSAHGEGEQTNPVLFLPDPKRVISLSALLDFGQRIGPLKTPPYVRAPELNGRGTGFPQAHYLQVRWPGDRPIVLDRRFRYFWLVDDAVRIRVAPKTYFGPRDLEAMGHVNLNDGRPGRLGGELFFEDGWDMDPNSGRYGINQPGLRQENLLAARDLLLQVGVSERDGTPIQAVNARFMPSIHDSAEPDKTALALKINQRLARGGYEILPVKGGDWGDTDPRFFDPLKRRKIEQNLHNKYGRHPERNLWTQLRPHKYTLHRLQVRLETLLRRN